MSDNSVDVNFDDEELDMIVHMYVRQALRKESVGVFNTTLNRTNDIKQALYHAVINDMVNDTLEAYIEKHDQLSDTSGTSE